MSQSAKKSFLSSIVKSTSPVGAGHPELNEVLARVNEVILGKDSQVKLTITCLLAKGHILIEDLPGVGKTTLVRCLAQAFGMKAQRIQFTNDMLPSDVLGTNIFDRNTGKFEFKQGPIFSPFVIGDELNRANPKTQSAFLQAMEEREISVEGQTYSLPEPFIVVATQNPTDHAGTFPLPESQLDRFLMRVSMGYPNAAAERELLSGESRQVVLKNFQAVMSTADLIAHQHKVQEVFASETVVNYVQRLLHESRQIHEGRWGLSPRSGLALLAAGRAWAYLHGRNVVLPEDIQNVAVSVMSHRLSRFNENGNAGEQKAHEIIQSVKVD